VKAVKVLSNKQSLHYRQLKPFDVLNIGGEEKLIAPVSASDEEIHYYVCYKDQFSIIHETHLTVGHGGRARMLKELNQKYKNITIVLIMAYLQLCEPCQKKQKICQKRWCCEACTTQ
jgi:hypothetical protein